jgi:hypothetical protein
VSCPWGQFAADQIQACPPLRSQRSSRRKPNELHAALIALMAHKDGATIQDFQGVDGLNIPSMAVVRIAERHGYQASASKKPGERTVSKAVKRAGG